MENSSSKKVDSGFCGFNVLGNSKVQPIIEVAS